MFNLNSPRDTSFRQALLAGHVPFHNSEDLLSAENFNNLPIRETIRLDVDFVTVGDISTENSNNYNSENNRIIDLSLAKPNINSFIFSENKLLATRLLFVNLFNNLANFNYKPKLYTAEDVYNCFACQTYRQNEFTEIVNVERLKADIIYKDIKLSEEHYVYQIIIDLKNNSRYYNSHVELTTYKINNFTYQMRCLESETKLSKALDYLSNAGYREI